MDGWVDGWISGKDGARGKISHLISEKTHRASPASRNWPVIVNNGKKEKRKMGKKGKKKEKKRTKQQGSARAGRERERENKSLIATCAS